MQQFATKFRLNTIEQMTNEAFIKGEIQMVTEKPMHLKIINSPKFPAPFPSFSTVKITCEVPYLGNNEEEANGQENQT